MKTCSRCKLQKSLDNYRPNSVTKDGYWGYCRPCAAAMRKAYYNKNKSLEDKRARQWAKFNEDKVKETKIRFFENHPGEANYWNSRRHAQKLNATPPWLTKAQLQEIKDIYALAKELQWLSEEPLEVDHIYPLQGKDVSGLHVPWNLQILPKSINVKKHNRMPDEVFK